ncbi:MAG: YihY family inner membrane protein [Zoogloeaceae bacterium]|jgi:membrane protein|nr:YihY family inner membrane protein [Zoogloeaceae bacterium]
MSRSLFAGLSGRFRCLALAGQIFRRFQESRCFTLSAALAYGTLLALTPTVALIMIVLGHLPGALEAIRQFDAWILPQVLPAGSGKIISAQILGFSRAAGTATLPGLCAMFVTALLLLENITQAFDSIWQNRKPRPVRHRLPLYLLVLFVWPVVIGLLLSILSYTLTLSQGWLRQLPLLYRFLPRLLSFLIPTCIFSLLYYYVPNVRVRPRHALCGGALAAACFFLMQSGFEWYLAYFPFYDNVYGALALIPIFLVWLYLAWVAILCGAFLAALMGAW